ncbi:hypothetical protein C0Q70_17733 [Pomacea canaliculata]|uniref:Uncharacterized protein n=1 Tax=Pomacea canaliculata TaxID=400727 RepID=A0A2T7NL84_POMCA|nr:hypothetical protein C0Q70_17733 [Pomacea canaliculata]
MLISHNALREQQQCSGGSGTLKDYLEVSDVTWSFCISREAADYISVYLRRPYTHAPSYFLPLLVGYVLHKRKFQSPLKLLPTLVTSALCIASVLAVVLGPACYSKGGSSLPLLLVVVYHALSHTVWALALSWLLFLYANGNLNYPSTGNTGNQHSCGPRSRTVGRNAPLQP